MVFTGPPDSPLINVRAVRKIEKINGAIIAGIDLSGRAHFAVSHGRGWHWAIKALETPPL